VATVRCIRATIWLHGGTYAGTFTTTLAGTSSADCGATVSGERATIDGVERGNV
jgi:hypothetical protein